MDITCLEQDGVLTLVLTGRLDSIGAGHLDVLIEKRILTVKDKLILDFANVLYASSSGLRVVIKYAKELRMAGKDFQLIHVNSDVYKIFKLTGFTSIIHITRNEKEIES